MTGTSAIGESKPVSSPTTTAPVVTNSLGAAASVVAQYTAKDIVAIRGSNNKFEGQLPNGQWVGLDSRGRPIIQNAGTAVAASSAKATEKEKRLAEDTKSVSAAIDIAKEQGYEVTESKFDGIYWTGTISKADDPNVRKSFMIGSNFESQIQDQINILASDRKNSAAPVDIKTPTSEEKPLTDQEYTDLNITIRHDWRGLSNDLYVSVEDNRLGNIADGTFQLSQMPGLLFNITANYKAVPKIGADDVPMAEIRNTQVAETNREIANEDTSQDQPTEAFSVRLTDGAVFNGQHMVKIDGKIGKVNDKTLSFLRSEILQSEPEYARYWEEN